MYNFKTYNFRSNHAIFMPPTLKKLKGILLWACPSVCMYVH